MIDIHSLDGVPKPKTPTTTTAENPPLQKDMWGRTITYSTPADKPKEIQTPTDKPNEIAKVQEKSSNMLFDGLKVLSIMFGGNDVPGPKMTFENEEQITWTHLINSMSKENREAYCAKFPNSKNCKRLKSYKTGVGITLGILGALTATGIVLAVMPDKKDLPTKSAELKGLDKFTEKAKKQKNKYSLLN